MAELFDVSLESGNLTGGGDAFTGTSGTGLSASVAAALAGTSYGMAAAITDTTGRYAYRSQTAPGSGTLRYRFYVDPNSLTMGDGEEFSIAMTRLSGSPWQIFECYMGYTTANGYYIGAYYQDDNGYVYGGSNQLVSDAPHYIEYRVVRAATDVSGDGTYAWWIDGSQVHSVGSRDNYDVFGLLSAVWLGPIYAIDAGTSGTMYYDQLLANDDGSEIGEHEEPSGAILPWAQQHLSQMRRS